MNNIIVGIDFSKSSINAFEYALGLASKTGHNLKLVYVSKARDIDTILPEGSKGRPTSAEKGFQKLIKKYENSITGKITYKILDGKIYEEITNLAKYTEAWLIVVGAHGMSGFEEFWVGNNAIKVIAHANKPVITIKKNFKIKPAPVEKIVLPIDSTIETVQKVASTLEFAKHFKAQINVLSLFSSKLKNIEERVENNTKEALSMVVKSGLRHINEKVVCDNITKATIDYAEKRNADMIAIMTEQEFSSQSVIMGTYAQQMVNQSSIPVLSIKTRVILPETSMLE
ncbi:MAG: universal stress protein [Bacteroidales bacterium]